MEYNEQKFTEMLLYVATKLSDDPAGGAVKLNKALHYSELAHIRLRGRPITGAEYQKLSQGPAPRRLLPIRDKLIEDGEAVIEPSSYYGMVQQRLVPRRDADLSVFDTYEIAMMNEVVADLKGKSGAEVSRMSHQEMGWFLAEENETIEWEMAYLKPASLTPEVRAHARRLATEHGNP